MSDVCPSSPKCPIYNGLLNGLQYMTQDYKNKYCNAGAAGRNSCLRWQVKQKYGEVPFDLLPNSMITVERVGQLNKYVAKN